MTTRQGNVEPIWTVLYLKEIGKPAYCCCIVVDVYATVNGHWMTTRLGYVEPIWTVLYLKEIGPKDRSLY